MHVLSATIYSLHSHDESRQFASEFNLWESIFFFIKRKKIRFGDYSITHLGLYGTIWGIEGSLLVRYNGLSYNKDSWRYMGANCTILWFLSKGGNQATGYVYALSFLQAVLPEEPGLLHRLRWGETCLQGCNLQVYCWAVRWGDGGQMKQRESGSRSGESAEALGGRKEPTREERSQVCERGA